jgi:hypothetical protein
MKIVLLRIAFSAAFALFGLNMLLTLVKVLRRQRELRQRGVIAEGDVIAYQSKSTTGGRGRTYYAPVVRFALRDGGRVQVTGSTYLQDKRYGIGQRVTMRYLPEEPDRADLDSETNSWFVPIALVVAIVVCFTVASLPFVLAS